MSIAKRVLTNTGILYARMAITIFISLYSTRIILEALGTEDYGIYNLIGGFVAMLAFLNSGMAVATQRFISFAQGKKELEDLKIIFNVSLILHLIIAAFLIIFLKSISNIIFSNFIKIPEERVDATKIIFFVSILNTAFTIISVPYEAIINARENMLVFAIVGIIESILKLIIAIYLMVSTYDKLIIYGTLMAMMSFVIMMVKLVYCHMNYPECNLNVKTFFRLTVFKEMAAFAGWSFLGSSTSIISNYGQGIVMNLFFSPKVNAAQGIASQVSGQLGVFSVTMLKALNPTIMKSEGAGNRSLLHNATYMGCKISFFLLSFMLVPFLVETEYILRIWLKSVPNYAVIFCQLLLIRNLIEQLFMPLVSSIFAVGKIKMFQIVAAIITLLPLPISFYSYKYGFQVYSLYIIYIFYSIIASLNILYFTKKYCGISLNQFAKEIIIRCISALGIIFILAILPKFLMNEGIIRLLAVLFTSSISSLIIIWMIGFTKMEKERILEIVSRIKYEVSPKIKGLLNYV
ncbi:MATE family efflux transporter [Nibrella saemangeumensis]|uniref:MATE family efflux transporter n=1 Tax=Nibrella saemangeumensis TaxID=1084526 RepID=A0ABP8N034_9BACT